MFKAVYMFVCIRSMRDAQNNNWAYKMATRIKSDAHPLQSTPRVSPDFASLQPKVTMVPRCGPVALLP